LHITDTKKVDAARPARRSEYCATRGGRSRVHFNAVRVVAATSFLQPSRIRIDCPAGRGARRREVICARIRSTRRCGSPVGWFARPSKSVVRRRSCSRAGCPRVDAVSPGYAAAGRQTEPGPELTCRSRGRRPHRPTHERARPHEFPRHRSDTVEHEWALAADDGTLRVGIPRSCSQIGLTRVRLPASVVRSLTRVSLRELERPKA